MAGKTQSGTTFRGPKTQVYVTIGELKYGWQMNEVKFNAIGATLGIKSAATQAGVFFGANSPKPGIASKEGSGSSFYDPSKGTELKSAGWKLRAARRSRGLKNSAKTKTVCVETPFGYKYAWNIPARNLDDVKECGVVLATASDTLVWGSFPKPPRGTKPLTSGSVSTFVAVKQSVIVAAEAAGFTVSGVNPAWGELVADPTP